MGMGIYLSWVLLTTLRIIFTIPIIVNVAPAVRSTEIAVVIPPTIANTLIHIVFDLYQSFFINFISSVLIYNNSKPIKTDFFKI